MAHEAKDDSDKIVNLKQIYKHRGYYDNDEGVPFDHQAHHKTWIFFYVDTIGCPIVIFGGVFTNILAFVVLVRSRLWLKHEGYVYLAANFCVNVGVLLFCTSTFRLLYETKHYYPPTTSNFICKTWHFLTNIFFASGWLSFALLFNVHLRDHLIYRRNCGCPMFAAKYCTLFASKIIVGLIFSVLFVLGIPYLAIYENRPGDRCLASTYYVLLVLFGEWLLMWFIPFVMLLIMLVATFCTMRESNIVGISQIEERSVYDQMRVMAITLSSMTFFSQLVLVFIHFFLDLGPAVLIGLIFSLSLGLQPILCFVILKALRDGFRSQLRDIRCCRRMFPSLVSYDEVVQMSAIQEDPPNATES